MIKTGFKKTKMFGLVGFIGLFVSLGLASTVNADETQPADVTIVAVTTDDGIQVDNKPTTDITPSITVYGDPNEDHTTVVEFTTDDGIQVDNKPSVTTYDNTSVVAFETNDNIATDNKVEVITNGTDETVEDAERGTINPNSGKEQGNLDTTPTVETEKTNPGNGMIASDKEQPIGNVEVPDSPVVQSRSRQQAHYITDDVKTVDAKKDVTPSVNAQQRKVLPHTGDNDSVAMVLFGITIILSVLNIAINIKDLKKQKRSKVTNTKC